MTINEILYDIKEFLRIQNKIQEPDVTLASLDCRSAFPNVHHTYIIAIFEVMEFPPEFLTLCGKILRMKYIKLKINGGLSPSISLQRDVLGLIFSVISGIELYNV